MKIAAEHIEKLRSRGLFVAEPRSPESCYPDGVLVGKPVNVPGNHIPGFSTCYADLAENKEVQFDAPPVWFYGHDGVWVVLAQDYSPVPGPGDFIDELNTPEEAIAKILDFYFGDPTRMKAKAKVRKSSARWT